MNYLAIVQTLISIVSTVANYFKDRQLIEAGVAKEALRHLQGASDAINAAVQTKLDVDKRTSGPDAAGKLRDDPGNLYRD